MNIRLWTCYCNSLTQRHIKSHEMPHVRSIWHFLTKDNALSQYTLDTSTTAALEAGVLIRALTI